MLDQYRLRLKDGTILAVDFDGLRTWLVEEKVMVQPPGSRQWRPLKHVLAQGRPAALIPRPAAVPVSAPAPPAAAAPAPIVAPPTPAETPIPVVPASALGVPVVPPEEYVEPDIPLTIEATAPLAEPVAPRGVKHDDGIAIIPLKPLDDEPPIHSTVAPAPPPPRRPHPAPRPEPVNLLDVASAEVERHSPREGPWHWTAPAAPDPRAAAGPPPIRLAPLDPEPEPETMVDDEVLPELDVVEERPPIINQEKVAAIVRDVSQQADRLLHDIAHSPVSTSAQAKITAVARRWAKWNLPVACAIALVLALAATRSLWMPLLSGSWSARQVAAPPPTLPAAPVVPARPPEVQAVIDRLPHLAPETVQLVMSSSRFSAPTAPEVFRLATLAADRGMPALSREESAELRDLRASSLGALRSVDRRRVQAYGRMTAGRDLLVAEDERVLALFARGVRALPEPRRERLQALLGKAIADALKAQPRETPLPR